MSSLTYKTQYRVSIFQRWVLCPDSLVLEILKRVDQARLHTESRLSQFYIMSMLNVPQYVLPILSQDSCHDIQNAECLKHVKGKLFNCFFETSLKRNMSISIETADKVLPNMVAGLLLDMYKASQHLPSRTSLVMSVETYRALVKAVHRTYNSSVQAYRTLMVTVDYTDLPLLQDLQQSASHISGCQGCHMSTVGVLPSSAEGDLDK